MWQRERSGSILIVKLHGLRMMDVGLFCVLVSLSVQFLLVNLLVVKGQIFSSFNSGYGFTSQFSVFSSSCFSSDKFYEEIIELM